MSKSDASLIFQAVLKESLPDVKIVIASGAAVEIADEEGWTPLFYASRDGLTEIAAELIKSGANVNARDPDLMTPLHFAAQEFHTDIALLLIESGAAVDSQDRYGNSPLWRAVFESQGRSEMIKLLLRAGADKTVRNKTGVSPDKLAKSINNYKVANLL
jgi:ankyrin repeat protein